MDQLRPHHVVSKALQRERRTAPSAEGAERFLTLWRRLCKWEGARRRAPKALNDSARSGTSSRWQQTTTPQERAAAAVPALRRGADNEQWCCCHDDVSDNERASGNGSIAVAGTQVASAPRVSRAVFLSHTSRCSVKFSSAHGGGRGREVCSPASWRCDFGRPGALLGSSVAFGSGCG